MWDSWDVDPWRTVFICGGQREKAVGTDVLRDNRNRVGVITTVFVPAGFIALF